LCKVARINRLLRVSVVLKELADLSVAFSILVQVFNCVSFGENINFINALMVDREQLNLVSHLNLLHIHEQEAELLLAVCREGSESAQMLPNEIGPVLHEHNAPQLLY
jgi:hypothetical protein